MQNNRKQQFGLQIRKLRQGLGLSQEKLANICSMDRTYIGGIERGERNVSLVNIFKISDALRVRPERLFQDILENQSSEELGTNDR